LADRARHALRSAEAGHRSDGDLGLTELRAFRRDDDVAGHRELATAAQCVARYGGDDGFTHTTDVVPILGDEIIGVDLLIVPFGHRADVRARSKRLLVAGYDDAADRRIGVERRKR